MTTPAQCRKCGQDSKVRPIELFDPETQFVLCPPCRGESTLYPKTFCTKQLLLPDRDLRRLKSLFTATPKVKYFLDTDVEHLVSTNFGRRPQRGHLARAQRKERLLQRLADRKLDYKHFGDCYTHVRYGYPDLETVIRNETERTAILSERKRLLCHELAKYNLPYSDREDSACYDFIYGINQSLPDTILDAEVENFFMCHTDYPRLHHLYPEDVARDKALYSYLERTDDADLHEIARRLSEDAVTLTLS